MNAAAQNVMQEFREIRIAFGQSDEFNFVFDKMTEIYGTDPDQNGSWIWTCLEVDEASSWCRW